MKKHIPAAPWSRSLKIVSFFGTLLVIVIGITAYRTIPLPSGFTHAFGLAIVGVFPAILLFSLLFTVSGYDLEGSDLLVNRLLWSTRISLAELRQVFADPTACKCSIRLFGNGGLFSFTGFYRNSRLGKYRLFATDFTRSVVLVFPDRTVVVTPDNPELFIHCVGLAVRAAQTGASGPGLPKAMPRGGRGG